MIKIISKKVLELAFSKGIDNFIEIYKLQANKNYVSETLGNFAMNFKSEKAVHTNYISDSEVDHANRIKAILNRDDNHDDFFHRFGTKLQELAKEKSNDCFITSYYSFIVLAVFHYASVIQSEDKYNNYLNYLNYLNTRELMSYYLTPNTRKKEVILPLYNIVGGALCNINTGHSLLDNTDQLIQIDNHVSDTEKLWAFLCSDGSPMKEKVKSFVDKDTFNKYSNLSTALLAKKKNDNQQYDQQLKADIQGRVKEAFDRSQTLLKKFDSIANAIAAYNLKFDQNTSGSIPGKDLAKKLSNKYSYEMIDVPITQFLAGVGSGSLGCLKTMFPPAFITTLVTELGFKLIEISMQSKGYGVINRHGITGQLRSHLLKDYIDMISVFIKNHYYYIFSQKSPDAVMRSSHVLIATINFFNDSYDEAIKLLPNQNQNGSLYYYLDMYVKGNRTKIEQWNKSKLGSIYN
ncbi:hypothetical protein [Francisella uliginis]|uniref:Uncharacterized protein n=1 Tax=Francisella uliginis TaxID=573570 RepID=A0A1L4BV03_9GAMM|nr:hypothetical protein [Francisella uliginis]API87671.1 hypothetical protein F7310_10050 [Francisella uliginis]